MYTAVHSHLYTEELIHRGTYARRNIHTERHTHEGGTHIHTEGNTRRGLHKEWTHTKRIQADGIDTEAILTEEMLTVWRGQKHGGTFTQNDIHTEEIHEMGLHTEEIHTYKGIHTEGHKYGGTCT